MGKRRELRRQAELNRLKVAELLVSQPGIRQKDIAAILGVSEKTVSLYVARVRAAWRERFYENAQQVVEEDLARTDAAIAAIWPAVLAGKGYAVDRLVSLLQYRLHAMGMDKQRVEHDVGALLAQYLERLADADTDSVDVAAERG